MEPISPIPQIPQPAPVTVIPPTPQKSLLKIIILLILFGALLSYVGILLLNNNNTPQTRPSDVAVLPTATPTKEPEDMTNWPSWTFTEWTNSITIKYPPTYIATNEGQLVGFSLATSQTALDTSRGGTGGYRLAPDDLVMYIATIKSIDKQTLDLYHIPSSTKPGHIKLGNKEVVTYHLEHGGMIYFVPNETNSFYGIFSTYPYEPKRTAELMAILSSMILVDETRWKKIQTSDYSFNYPNIWQTDNHRVFDPATQQKGGNETMYKSELWYQEIPSSLPVDSYAKQTYGNMLGFIITTMSANIAAKPVTIFYNPVGESTTGWYAGVWNGTNILLFGPTATNPEDDNTLRAIINSADLHYQQ